MLPFVGCATFAASGGRIGYSSGGVGAAGALCFSLPLGALGGAALATCAVLLLRRHPRARAGALAVAVVVAVLGTLALAGAFALIALAMASPSGAPLAVVPFAVGALLSVIFGGVSARVLRAAR